MSCLMRWFLGGRGPLFRRVQRSLPRGLESLVARLLHVVGDPHGWLRKVLRVKVEWTGWIMFGWWISWYMRIASGLNLHNVSQTEQTN